MEKFLFEDLFEEILVRSKAQEYFSWILLLESTKFFSSDFLSSDSIIYIFYLKILLDLLLLSFLL